MSNPLARIPRVDAVLGRCDDLVATFGHDVVVAEVRLTLEEERGAVRRGGTPAASVEEVAARVRRRVRERLRQGPRRVINAAGIVVHTNLGRAPLSAAAIEAMIDAAGYCDLEYDLDGGGRGSRGSHIDALLAAAVDAQDAMVVNSCAAALVLALAALASGRQVPVSRGQLVEIGGSFRLPEIMAASGARLLEVGTTNRTRAEDYRRGEDVAALLTVHPSNFTQQGFVEQAPLAEVAAVARERGVPLLHDAGAGLLRTPATGPLAGEPDLRGDLLAGADLVLASGDKLLGGPQAGLVVGRGDLVQRLRRHPLARAVRVDKLRLAALMATLRGHLAGDLPPVLRMIGGGERDASLARRTAEMAAAVGGSVVDGRTMVGGGSAPGQGIDGVIVRVAPQGTAANDLAAHLRQHDPPVIARVSDGAVLLDLCTVDPRDDTVVVAAVVQALRSGPVSSG